MRFNSAAAILSLCLVASLSVAGTITGKVVGVSDGDTITVLDASHGQHKIRLEGSGARKMHRGCNMVPEDNGKARNAFW